MDNAINRPPLLLESLSVGSHFAFHTIGGNLWVGVIEGVDENGLIHVSCTVSPSHPHYSPMHPDGVVTEDLRNGSV